MRQDRNGGLWDRAQNIRLDLLYANVASPGIPGAGGLSSNAIVNHILEFKIHFEFPGPAGCLGPTATVEYGHQCVYIKFHSFQKNVNLVT